MFSIERLDLVEGTYKLDVAVHKLDGYPYDYHRLLYTFRVKSRDEGRRDLSAAARWRFSTATSRSSAPTGDASRRDRTRCLSLGRRASSSSSEPSRAGDAIVFTNGVFDLLHPGHVRYLQRGPRARRRARSSGSTPTRRSGATRAGAADHARAERAEVLAALDMRGRGRDLRRGHAARDHRARSSRMCSSRARTGPADRSSAATRSRRAADASSACRSSQGYSTSAIIEKIRST